MKIWLKLSVSLALLFFIFYKIGIQTILITIANINLIFILPVILLQIITLVIDSYNLYILIPNNKRIPALKLISYNIYCWSVGLLLPVKAGDLLIIPALKKKGITIGESLAAIVMNKLSSLSITVIIAFLGMYLFLRSKLISFTLIILLCASIITLFIFSEKFRLIIRKKILRSYESYFKGFSRNLKLYFTKKIKLLLLNLFLTLIKIFIGILVPFLLFYSLGIHINFFILLIIFITVTLLSFVPFTLSGLGLKEAALWFFLDKLNISPEAIGSVILLSLAITYGLGFIFSITLKTD